MVSDAALLGVVALVALVIVALVVVVLAFLRPVASAPSPAAPHAMPIMVPTLLPQAPTPVRAPVARSAASGPTLEIDVPTKHVDEFMSALRASGWRVHETGEVVATDEHEEGLTTVLVDVPQAPNRAATGEEIR